MSLRITMDGKYAERRSPRAQVRVLCIDRPHDQPVVVLDASGGLSTYSTDGSYYENMESEYDLVPLDETLVVTPGKYRTRKGDVATVCYVRSRAEFRNYLAIGWLGTQTATHTWRLDGRFSNEGAYDNMDLVERIGDLP